MIEKHYYIINNFTGEVISPRPLSEKEKEIDDNYIFHSWTGVWEKVSILNSRYGLLFDGIPKFSVLCQYYDCFNHKVVSEYDVRI